MAGIDLMEKTCILAGAEFMASSGPAPQAQTVNEITAIDIDKVEAHMLTLPQVECPVEHIFGPGIYMRQVFMPAGAIVLGHKHKQKSLNVMLTGSLAILEDGVMREIKAPYIFTSEVGRKLAYVLEGCTFLNIYATEETDTQKLEEMFVDKTPAYEESRKWLG